MFFRFVIVFLLCLTPIFAAKPKLSKKVKQELRQIPSYQKGIQAMADLLPDLAIPQFKKTLSGKKLSPSARQAVSFALIESLIQASLNDQGSPDLAEEALQRLQDKKLQHNEYTPILKAEALAALGRYQEAESTLAQITNKHSQYREIQIARAKILILIQRQSDALKVLNDLLKHLKHQSQHSRAIKNTALLIIAEIRMNQGDFIRATLSLEQIKEASPTTKQLSTYLTAHLHLAIGKTTEAISEFQELIDHPNNLKESIYNACILDLSDAYIASKQYQEALAVLENFIDKSPESPILPSIFTRLSKLLKPDLLPSNPSMKKLILWSSPPMSSLTDTIQEQSNNKLYIKGPSADAIPMTQTIIDDRLNLMSLSLSLRAQLLAKSKNPQNWNKALWLLTQLRTLQTDITTPLSELYLQLFSSSLLETAEIQMRQKKIDLATYTLAVMSKIAFSPELKDRALFLLGTLHSKEANYDDALAAFSFVRESNDQDFASAATINTGITALLSGKIKTFDTIINSTNSPKVYTSLLLERALWKCKNNDIRGRRDLKMFVFNHLGHPRENEARMALATACLDIAPPDIPLAKKQIEIISKRWPDAKHQYDIFRIRIRAEELQKKWLNVAKLCVKFIKQFPNDARIPNMLLKEGEAYYNNGDFHKARAIFQQINDQYPKSSFAPYSQFYTAMAALLGGTTQSREESIVLFQKIIDSNHPLAQEARIQQSRVLIDFRRYPEAIKTLQPLNDTKKISPAVYRDAMVLMADCLNRQGASNPKKYKEALKIYDKILKLKDLPITWHNRLHYLRGQTLESMNQPRKALESYYSVIAHRSIAKDQKKREIEWFWFYRCGFKALALLEEDKRWEAAVKLARRLASFHGPRSKEASDRADTLARIHMIWEEDSSPSKAIEIPE